MITSLIIKYICVPQRRSKLHIQTSMHKILDLGGGGGVEVTVGVIASLPKQRIENRWSHK